MFKSEIGYELTALRPYISEEALTLHYTRHHASYAEKLNALIAGTDMEHMPLEEIIKSTRGKNDAIFNNASQLFNHNFYWESLLPWHELKDSALKYQAEKQFGSIDMFYNTYEEFAGKLFGSGWSWLVVNKSTKELEFLNTSNAENPVGNDNLYPICVIDLWEHAYYVDYNCERLRYIGYMIKRCINWDHVSKMYDTIF